MRRGAPSAGALCTHGRSGYDLFPLGTTHEEVDATYSELATGCASLGSYPSASDGVTEAMVCFSSHGAGRWRVTVTDYFGGRGIDYRLSDDGANEAGGLMVIITSIPDSQREWVQWIGRTARQDKNGQISVLLHKEQDLIQKSDTAQEASQALPQETPQRAAIIRGSNKRQQK